MDKELPLDFDLNAWVDTYTDTPVEDIEAIAVDTEANE